MKKLKLFPLIPAPALHLLLYALIGSPFVVLAGASFWLQAGLSLFLYAAHLLGYALRVETELTSLSAHNAELAALRRKHEADFKTYLEFVKTSSMPSKN